MAEPKNDPAQQFQQILQQLSTTPFSSDDPFAYDDFTTEPTAAEGKPFLRPSFDTVFTTKIDNSGGGAWLAEDHGPSDPSDGFVPTESWRPTESLVVVDCPILSNPNESGDFYLI